MAKSTHKNQQQYYFRIEIQKTLTQYKLFLYASNKKKLYICMHDNNLCIQPYKTDFVMAHIIT